jgi:methylase of polypeptide subunit release factors
MISLEEHLQNVIRAHEVLSEPYIIKYFGEKYIVFPKVFSPVLTASTTTAIRSMIKRRKDFEGRTILDMGCGCGVLAIEALKLGAAFGVAVDISNIAFQNTLENIRRLGMEKSLVVVESDLFSKVSENGGFDVVLANLPLVDRRSESELDSVFFDEGYLTSKRFLNSVGDRLVAGGKVFFNCASIVDTPRMVNWAARSGLLLEEVELFEDYIFDHYVFIFRKP